MKSANSTELQAAKDKKDQALKQYYVVESDLRTKENRKKDLARRLDETKDRINLAQEKLERMEKIRRTVELLSAVRDAYRSIQPKLRSEFVKVLRNFVRSPRQLSRRRNTHTKRSHRRNLHALCEKRGGC